MGKGSGEGEGGEGMRKTRPDPRQGFSTSCSAVVCERNVGITFESPVSLQEIVPVPTKSISRSSLVLDYFSTSAPIRVRVARASEIKEKKGKKGKKKKKEREIFKNTNLERIDSCICWPTFQDA